MCLFSLSSSNFKNLNFEYYQKDFAFIVNGEKIQCNRVIADIVSPNVRRFHQIDPTINEMIVVDDFLYDEGKFEQIISLGEGNEINIDETDYDTLEFFFKAIGNNEFSEFLFEHRNVVNESNIIGILKKKIKKSLPIDKEISFFASHLYLFDYSSLMCFGEDVLSLVLSNENVVIENEEWLFRFVLNATRCHSEYSILFEYIDFANLSSESLVDFTREVLFDDMSAGIWQSIIRRLICKVVTSKPIHQICDQSLTFPYKGGETMNGIISFLSKQYGGNVSKKGIVNVTSSSILSSSMSYNPISVADLDTDDYFFSQNLPNQWVMYDFLDNVIVPAHYAIKSNCDGINGNHPKHWVLEGSIDGLMWEELDKQTNNDSLNSRYTVSTFPVNKQYECRYVRFRLTGKNWNNSFDLIITGMEIYGRLIKKKKSVL